MDEFKVELNAASIHLEIQNYINKDVSYLEALTYYAEIHNIELDVLAAVIKKNSSMKMKLREVAEKMNLVQKENLSIDEFL